MPQVSEQFVSYEQLDSVRRDVDVLSPGYAIQELDPTNALITGQGNCFTSAMIAGCVVAKEFGVDASVVWSSRLHATKRPDGMQRKAIDGKTTDLNIAHIELLVPRGGDQYDVLGLGYGLEVNQGIAFTKQDAGGKITNYNYFDFDPQDLRLDKPANRADDALVQIGHASEISPTNEGRSLGIVACDWQSGGNEYLAALNIPPIDYEALESKVGCFLQAMRDGRQILPINPASS